MAHDPSQISPVFRIDVSAEPGAPNTSNTSDPAQLTVALLHQMLAAQQKQNQLMEQLLQATVSMQKQRAHELQQWKEANPRLAKSCRRAADVTEQRHRLHTDPDKVGGAALLLS